MLRHHVSSCRQLIANTLVIVTVLAGSLLDAPQAFGQMRVIFDSLTVIFDGGAGDTDGVTNGKIDFSGVYGNAGYQVSGRLQETPSWPVGSTVAQQLTSPVYGLTLTNFTAEALGSSQLGSPLAINVQSDAFTGLYGPGTAADSLSAEVGHATSGVVPPNMDTLLYFESIVGDNVNAIVIQPATGAPVPLGNPPHVGAGTTPYPITGHGIQGTPGLVNPVLYGLIGLQLGQVGDQFIMPNSYEIGYSAALVPEPSTWVLAAMGFAALVWFRRRTA